MDIIVIQKGHLATDGCGDTFFDTRREHIKTVL